MTTQSHLQIGPQIEPPTGAESGAPSKARSDVYTQDAAQDAAQDAQNERGSDRLVVQQQGIVSTAATPRETLIQGRRAFQQGDDAEAVAHLQRLIDRGIDYADVHYMIGIMNERQGRLDEALVSLRRSIQLNPSYAEALLALASLYEERGDFDTSESYARRASQLTQSVEGQLDPTTRGKLANQQAGLADALVQAGELRDAIDEYRRALQRCPNFHDIRHRLGITLREAGLPFQAAQEFQRILATHNGMLESQVQLGLTYYSLGRTPEAIQEWDAVLERDPSRDDARMYLRMIRNANERRLIDKEPHTPSAVESKSEAPGWSKRPLEATTDNAPAAPRPAFDPTISIRLRESDGNEPPRSMGDHAPQQRTPSEPASSGVVWDRKEDGSSR